MSGKIPGGDVVELQGNILTINNSNFKMYFRKSIRRTKSIEWGISINGKKIIFDI